MNFFVGWAITLLFILALLDCHVLNCHDIDLKSLEERIDQLEKQIRKGK